MKRSVVALLMAVMLLSGVFIGQATARQPHMQAALSALRTARHQLQAASHDKGGHRVNALNLVNQAITQVELGIASDRRN